MLTAANADTSVCTLDVIVFAFPGIPHKGVHFKDFSDEFRILQKKQFCFAFCVAVEYWFDTDVHRWPLNSCAYFCVFPPVRFPFPGWGSVLMAVCTERGL